MVAIGMTTTIKVSRMKATYGSVGLFAASAALAGFVWSQVAGQPTVQPKSQASPPLFFSRLDAEPSGGPYVVDADPPIAVGDGTVARVPADDDVDDAGASDRPAGGSAAVDTATRFARMSREVARLARSGSQERVEVVVTAQDAERLLDEVGRDDIDVVAR
jgi:hypothetical protein